MTRTVRAAAVPLALMLSAACADRPGALEPAAPAPQPALAAVQCRASVAARTLACTPARPAGGAAGDLILGGQGVNVQLASTHVAYDSASETLSANVTLQNLLGQPVGTTDGTTVEGIRVFFQQTPVTLVGTGEVEVGNPDGIETFTGSGQPYFLYPEILQPYERTADKRWEFKLPVSVESFSFQVYVQAAAPNATGVLRWEQVRGSPVTRSLYSVWGSGAGDVWVAGTRTLMHFDGTRWAVVPTNTNDGFGALQGSSAHDVWALKNGILQHYDGRRWTTVNTGLGQVWGNVFAAGAGDVYLDNASGQVAHWDGESWTLLPGTAGSGGRMWASGPNDLYLSHNRYNSSTGSYTGVVHHWNGTAWSETTLNPGGLLTSIWGTGPANVWVSTYDGAVLHWDGAAWTRTQLISQPLNGVAGSGPNDVWAVGGSFGNHPGRVLHWDGSAWSEVQTGATSGINAVWAPSPGVAVTVGDNGVVMRYDGQRWTALSMPLPELFTHVLPVEGDGAYATTCSDGAGVMHTTDGTTWTAVAAPGDCMHHLWIGGGQIFAVGEQVTNVADGPLGVVARWDGAAWHRDTIPGRVRLSGVWGTGPGDVYAVGYREGDPGAQTVVILHWDGGAWTLLPVGYGGQLEAVWGSGPSNIWAVGTMTVLHYDGTRWTSGEGPAGSDANHGVWGSGPDDVFIAGGWVYHWDGSSWSTYKPVNNFIGYGVWGSGPGDVYVVGTQTLHWNGATWGYVDTNVSATLWGINGQSNRDLWVVGEKGVVLRGRR